MRERTRWLTTRQLEIQEAEDQEKLEYVWEKLKWTPKSAEVRLVLNRDRNLIFTENVRLISAYTGVHVLPLHWLWKEFWGFRVTHHYNITRFCCKLELRGDESKLPIELWYCSEETTVLDGGRKNLSSSQVAFPLGDLDVIYFQGNAFLWVRIEKHQEQVSDVLCWELILHD